jgi:hypothetical protein
VTATSRVQGQAAPAEPATTRASGKMRTRMAAFLAEAAQCVSSARRAGAMRCATC